MRISCLQYTAEPDLALSESRLYPLLDQAVAARPEAILLPECALFLSSNQSLSRAHALASDAEEVMRLQQYAVDHQVTLIVGSLIMNTDQGVKNRTLVIQRDGSIAATYDKIHLFDVDLASGESYRESALFEAGSMPVMTSIAGWTVGLSICFRSQVSRLIPSLWLGRCGPDCCACGIYEDHRAGTLVDAVAGACNRKWLFYSGCRAMWYDHRGP